MVTALIKRTGGQAEAGDATFSNLFQHSTRHHTELLHNTKSFQVLLPAASQQQKSCCTTYKNLWDSISRSTAIRELRHSRAALSGAPGRQRCVVKIAHYPCFYEVRIARNSRATGATLQWFILLSSVMPDSLGADLFRHGRFAGCPS